MDFSYRTIEERIEITAYHGSNSVVYVPEEIDGRSVTVIGKYAFEGNNDILEVVLPDSVERIGSHAFYNCRRVEKMRMSDRIVETEDGAFKNCRSLREFQIRVILHKMTCLKNLLSELSQELHITLEYTGQEQSRLVFPRYL
ncbi:MAG: leucine-rich repeat protein, partial [Clostridium sp.]|nr:leucine-rich repeat protein [Clostridium sp.]